MHVIIKKISNNYSKLNSDKFLIEEKESLIDLTKDIISNFLNDLDYNSEDITFDLRVEIISLSDNTN